MASDFFQFPFIFLLCPIASNNIHDNTQCWQPIPRPSFGKQVPYSKIIVYILFGTGIMMMSKKERPARVGTRMARAHICEHQLLLSNFTNEPKFPSTSHDPKKTHPSGSKTFANVRCISKFDAHMCRNQLARKTPVGCQEGKRYHPRAGNVVSMPHSSPVIFPTGMWPCVGMIVVTHLGSMHQNKRLIHLIFDNYYRQ